MSVLPVADDVAPPSAKVTGVELKIPKRPYYAVLKEYAGRTHTQVGFVHSLQIELLPTSLAVNIHPSVLPFGLVESILVMTPKATATNYQVCLHKISGMRDSAWTNIGFPVSMHSPELAIDYDASHRSLDIMKRATGHEMSFRMIAGSSILNLTIRFDAPPPAEIIVAFKGANAIPAVLTPATAAERLREKKALPLLLKPLSMDARKLQAAQAFEDLEARVEAEPTAAAEATP